MEDDDRAWTAKGASDVETDESRMAKTLGKDSFVKARGDTAYRVKYQIKRSV